MIIHDELIEQLSIDWQVPARMLRGESNASGEDAEKAHGEFFAHVGKVYSEVFEASRIKLQWMRWGDISNRFEGRI